MRVLLPPDRGTVRGAARAAVLAEWMRAWLATEVRVELARDYATLTRAIVRGDADVAWAPPSICASVRNRVAALLTIVRYGKTSCRSALVVRADAGFRTCADLRGKRASWVDPLSTNGYLMAIVHLQTRGLDPRAALREQWFAGSYRDALADVAEGRADVTSVFVVDDDEQATLRELYDLLGPQASCLALLTVTEPAPFDGIAIGAHVRDAELLVRKLLALEQRMRPPAMLLEVCRADCFVLANADDYALLDGLGDAHLDS